jgi:hypothetical protein
MTMSSFLSVRFGSLFRFISTLGSFLQYPSSSIQFHLLLSIHFLILINIIFLPCDLASFDGHNLPWTLASLHRFSEKSTQIQSPSSNDRARGNSSPDAILLCLRHKYKHLLSNAWHSLLLVPCVADYIIPIDHLDTSLSSTRFLYREWIEIKTR